MLKANILASILSQVLRALDPIARESEGLGRVWKFSSPLLQLRNWRRAGEQMPSWQLADVGPFLELGHP